MSVKQNFKIKKTENGKVSQSDLVRIPVVTSRSSRMENLISQFSLQNPEPQKKIFPKKNNRNFGHKYSKSVNVNHTKSPKNNTKKFNQFSKRKDFERNNNKPIDGVKSPNPKNKNKNMNNNNNKNKKKNKNKNKTNDKSQNPKRFTNRQGIASKHSQKKIKNQNGVSSKKKIDANREENRKTNFDSTIQRFNSIALGEKIILQNKTKLTPIKNKKKTKEKPKKKTNKSTKNKKPKKPKKNNKKKKKGKKNENLKVQQESIKNVLDIAKQLESKPLAGRGLSLGSPVTGKKLKKMSKKSKLLHEKQEKQKKKQSKKKRKEQDKQLELQKRKEKEKEKEQEKKEKEKEKEQEKRKRREEKRKKKEEERLKKQEKKLREKELQSTTLQFSEKELVDLLFHPNKEALDLIIKTLKKLKKCDKIVLFILQIYETNSKTFELINYCLKKEIQTTKNFENLFRSNTFATKLTTASGKMYGREYLIQTLKDPVVNLIEDSENLEIDPNEFDEDISFNFLELNCQRMQDKADLFLQSIFNTESLVPK
ncbi:hypothetical protein M0812_11992 [Anaeramoeba flamelloides]|uniref:Ras-GAP domain-containing protein n=1 Tax=Anaeramoeba flamelloides TaxID=1746091 RepID=A0AAV7ZJV6_9EUKA|nr:hypothetical protein M0812_11992 [Anaeramoeba flamelloides]